jgi:site-specific recombinase XerD
MKRLTDVARGWLRYLGSLRQPVEQIPFQLRLDEYCEWAKQEVGLSEATIFSHRSRIKQFLQWYGISGRPLPDVQITDIDAYIAHGSKSKWKARVTVRNVVDALRAFFHHGSQEKWCHPHLSESIEKPRLYSLENLPAGPTWVDVQHLFASLDPSRPKDIRDRAILMLLAVYGLRSSEVANLCLDDIDWEHDQLRVFRSKRRGAQVYPLIPSVGNALVEYLRTVRYPSSSHRNVFLTLLSPYAPLSKGGMHHVVAPRLRSLNVRTLHHGPHSLRHACASRLLAEGLSLKEIGDHLGHRSPSATRTYTKVDFVGLRKVAEFDLGELS